MSPAVAGAGAAARGAAERPTGRAARGSRRVLPGNLRGGGAPQVLVVRRRVVRRPGKSSPAGTGAGPVGAGA